MRILLAEDDPHISVIMQLCLEKIGGHSVRLAYDGEQALALNATEKFDLILLDGMMPKKSGLQVARELRATPTAKLALAPPPIIFLSARSDEEDYLSLGIGYIAKPFDPSTICHRIDEIMLEAMRKTRTAG